MIKERFSDKINDLISEDEWLIVQDEYNPKDNLVYETNFALTNGYMCTRASYEEGTKISLPTTFIAGIFDKSEAFMRELANTPDWLGLKLYNERDLIGIEDCEIIEFIRVLDMKKSILFKRYILRDTENRETLIEGYRFLSRNNLHRAAIRLYVTPLNYSGIMEMENIIDGTVLNFKDFPRFRVKHLETLDVSNLSGKGCYIETRTRDFKTHIGTGCIVKVSKLNQDVSIIKNKRYSTFGEIALEFNDFDVKEKETIVIDKMASVYTQRDIQKEKIKSTIANELSNFSNDGIDQELDKHIKIYEDMWQYANIKITGDDLIDKGLRFNIFHLMSTANKHNDKVSLGAKLLHGEEYGGHAYWDTEIFMLPFFIFTAPDVAKNLLKYRYYLLDAARQNAISEGYKGAKYPWESADDGKEQCPQWTIEPDGSCYRCYVADYEHHVTADIAYGVYSYYKYTDDVDFMTNYGAEIILETARFWVSRCNYNEKLDRYEILQVTGPDEWHEPVDNNCYTNYLAKWNIEKGFEILDLLKTSYESSYQNIISKIGLEEAELKEWKAVCEKIYIPFNEEDKLMEQFDGYFKLHDFVITEYDKNDMPIIPSKAREVGIRNTCINKQADVVMLMFLLDNEFDKEIQKINYDYYEKRTSHRSSLSPSIFSIMGLRVGNDSMAYKYLKRSCLVDLHNNQNNTREGIHAASCGGTWQSVIFGFAGMSIDENGIINFNPCLPQHWEKIEFKINYSGSIIDIVLSNSDISAKLLKENKEKIKLKFKSDEIYL